MKGSLKKAIKDIFDKYKNEKMESLFIKDENQNLYSVDGGELVVDAAILAVADDEEGTTSEVADSDIVLSTGETITIKDGKITVITPKKEESEDAPASEEMSKAKFRVITQVNKWSMDIDQEGAIELGTILTQTYTDADGVKGEPLPVCANEYEIDGNTYVTDANGMVVAINPEKGAEEKPTEDALVEDEQMAKIEARFAALEAKLDVKEKELEATKEAFEKLKAQPAAKAIETKRFEFSEIKTSTKPKSELTKALDEIFAKSRNK